MASTSTERKQKRKAIVITSDEEDDTTEVNALDRDSTVGKLGRVQFPHNREKHHINDAAAQSIQEQLTTWFSTVHDTRGMPWRRRWDPSLSPEAKAQRAYEVGSAFAPRDCTNTC